MRGDGLVCDTYAFTEGLKFAEIGGDEAQVCLP